MSSSSPAARVALALIVITTLSTVGSAHEGFLQIQNVRKEDVAATLLADLHKNNHHVEERVVQYENALRTMFASMAKNKHGNLGHLTARYVLHRLFIHQSGWVISGLDPSVNVSSLIKAPTWMGTYVQELLEQFDADRGLNLRELAVLATTFEKLIHAETSGRLERVFDLLGVSTSVPLERQGVANVLDTYMTAYTSGSNFTNMTLSYLKRKMNNFIKRSPVWPKTQMWLRQVEDEALPTNPDSSVDFHQLQRLVETINVRFGRFNDGECQTLKSTLLTMEDRRKAGRVRLSDFYSGVRASYFKFNEKVEYLRALGALDESDPDMPFLIVPNYVTAWPQCLKGSGIYGLCCRNECEALLTHLEEALVAPRGSPERIAELVAALPSATVSAPRQLLPSLRARLDEIASYHGGHVPLHGRLFAQWLHHAYPAECPVPPDTRTAVTADEWMESTGHTSVVASAEEVASFVATRGQQDEAEVQRDDGSGEALERDELPWSVQEVLFDTVVEVDGFVSAEAVGNNDGLRGVLRQLACASALASMAVGLVRSARTAVGAAQQQGVKEDKCV